MSKCSCSWTAKGIVNGTMSRIFEDPSCGLKVQTKQSLKGAPVVHSSFAILDCAEVTVLARAPTIFR